MKIHSCNFSLHSKTTWKRKIPKFIETQKIPIQNQSTYIPFKVSSPQKPHHSRATLAPYIKNRNISTESLPQNVGNTLRQIYKNKKKIFFWKSLYSYHYLPKDKHVNSILQQLCKFNFLSSFSFQYTNIFLFYFLCT